MAVEPGNGIPSVQVIPPECVFCSQHATTLGPAALRRY
jgi:hypothetical protein